MPPQLDAWKSLVGKEFLYPQPALDELRAFETLLTARGISAGPILGIFSGGLVEPTKMLLSPEGIIKLSRWRLQTTWQYKGWAPKFADISKPTSFYSHSINGVRDEFALKYVDQKGKPRQATLLFELDSLLAKTVLWSLLGPYRAGITLEEAATITITERVLKQSNDRRPIASISGTLVAIGPQVLQHGEKLVIDWGPSLALIPRKMPNWERTLNQLWRDAAEKYEKVGSIVGYFNQQLALAGGILSALKPDNLVQLEEPLFLPTRQDFLQSDRRFYGSLEDDPGQDRQWEWKRGSNDRHLYVFQNYWLYRCLLWANQNLTMKPPPAQSS